MNTDTPFYRLFQERPETVFELAGLPVPQNPAYRLHAEEVKQTAFRLDGVLLPQAGRDDLPLIFVEAQFYPKADFYARWLAAIFLYLPYRLPTVSHPPVLFTS
jgi:predicted transposase YdaD